MVKRAWLGTLVKTVDPKTGAISNPIISGFKKTGLWPFSRDLLTKACFDANKWWKLQKEKVAPVPPAEPSAARPKLTLSEEERVALRAAAFDINVVLDMGA